MKKNIVFIQGRKIDLLVKNIDNIEIYHKWVNKPVVRKYIGVELPENIEVMKKEWFPDERDEKSVWLEIWHKEDKIPIGMVGFFDRQSTSRRAEIGIFIGETEYWGKGIGVEVVNLMLDYGFNTLNYHKIVAGVNSSNTRSLGMFKKLGFIEEGHQKDMDFIDGKFNDIILFGKFAKDRKGA